MRSLGGKLLVGFVFLTMMMSFVPTGYSESGLKVGFYKRSCHDAESIVSKVVGQAITHNPGIGAGLIRLHFHDCFVRGCDGSVLLKSMSGGLLTERDHPANNPGLRGFEVIDEAKRRIEAICPETVSCADILAFAARDSANKLGSINYRVPAGRRDGRLSNFSEVAPNLPHPTLTADQLIQHFARKGLSANEMVTLSGAHSIGVAHCSSFSKRMYTFNQTHAQDPSLNQAFAASMKTRCPLNGPDRLVRLESRTPYQLDNRYYEELKAGRGLLTSDQTLAESLQTRNYVMKNAKHGPTWAAKFGRAMRKMGSIDILTQNQGEIRRMCSLVN